MGQQGEKSVWTVLESLVLHPLYETGPQRISLPPARGVAPLIRCGLGSTTTYDCDGLLSPGFEASIDGPASNDKAQNPVERATGHGPVCGVAPHAPCVPPSFVPHADYRT